MQGKETVRNATKSILVYVIWMIFSFSQVGLAIWIHDVIFSVALLVAKNAWAPRAIDMWSMFILGMVVLATIFLTETYLQNGMKLQRFWQRVGVVALVEGVIALVLLGLGFIL
jgi:hypothetical protein